MFDEQSEMERKPHQPKKLILSAPSDDPNEFHYEGTHKAHIPSGQLTCYTPDATPVSPSLSSPLPHPISALLRRRLLWNRDPAYTVLSIALVVVVIMSIVGTTFARNILGQVPALLEGGSANTTPQNAPTGLTTQGTVDWRPTFPTPGGGKGSTASSQPPTKATAVLYATSTVPPNPSPTVQPTPTQGGGQLTLQISSIPAQVNNNSAVPVVVQANEPGVRVKLAVTYSAAPGFYTSGAQLTDDNGNATLAWQVNVFGRITYLVLAEVVAVARDQNGQQVSSQSMTVEVIGRG